MNSTHLISMAMDKRDIVVFTLGNFEIEKNFFS